MELVQCIRLNSAAGMFATRRCHRSHGAGTRDAHSDAVRERNVRASDGLTRLVLSDLTQVNAFSCSKCPPAPALFCVVFTHNAFVFTPPTLH